MKSKLILFSIFIIVVIAQLFVSGKMVADQYNIIKKGKEFKFETTPLDPNDPFRGKYIHLRFKNDKFLVASSKEWQRNQDVFVILGENKNGFAKIEGIQKTTPIDNVDYIKAKIKHVYSNSNSVRIEYPFERFYMKETKAKNAELLHNKVVKDTSKTIYASVYIKDGKSILNDVQINGKSLRNLVEKEELN